MHLTPSQGRQSVAEIHLLTILKDKLHEGRPVLKRGLQLYNNHGKPLDGIRFMPSTLHTSVDLIFITSLRVSCSFNFYFIAVETETQRDE